MSKENVKAFMEKLATDKELQDKINDRARVAEAVIIPVAKEAGFDFTVEELRAYLAEMPEKVAEGELEDVAGGQDVIRCSMGSAYVWRNIWNDPTCRSWLGQWA